MWSRCDLSETTCRKLLSKGTLRLENLDPKTGQMNHFQVKTLRKNKFILNKNKTLWYSDIIFISFFFAYQS